MSRVPNARLAGAVLLALAAAGNAFADAGALRSKYSELREQLRQSPYQRPIHIDSAEAGDSLKGDVYAVLDAPFDTVAWTLSQPADWCDILVLPFNSKFCQPVQNGKGLHVRIARRPDQPVAEAYPVNFNLRQAAATSEYFESQLTAAEGPVGTRDYRITLEAVPLEGGRRTFMRLGYSYGVGGMGRLAMQTYLGTAGANKVGFTVTGRDANGEPVYIGGVRGAIERNVMRYYLAIDAHLKTLGASPEQQLDRRLETWFNSTERYARQLREMDKNTYMTLKRGDYERQQAQLGGPPAR